MKVACIIPARYASVRFPGKPLIDIDGKPMIQRVYEQSLRANLSEVIVATDDERIAEAVRLFGGNVMLTSPHHLNGTERVAEVAAQISADVIINIQGDEPFIQPEQINLLADCFKDDKVQIATLAKAETSAAFYHKNSIIKVVTDLNGKALYFSRSPIPFYRANDKESTFSFLKHIGIYAFKKEVLLKLVQLPASELEQAEMLEQLRWLQNGYAIKVALTTLESISVDTPEDLLLIKERYLKN